MAAVLDGRTAFVAGATGPIGRAVCAALATAGARIAVHYHRHAGVAAELALALPGEHVAIGADLTDPAALDEAFAGAADRLGAPSVLVNAAHPSGSHEPTSVADLDPASLREQLGAVEVHAALCRAAVPAMRSAGWGRIVFVSGALMARPAPGFGAYGAAKAAASTLTRYLALEEGRAGITANIVAPGRVVDPAVDEELTPELTELSRRLLERMALPSFPSPAQVADVVAALVGPAGDSITGQTIFVTGGEPIA